MITFSNSTPKGMAVKDSPDVVVSIGRGGMNRLSLLAMMVPLLLLVGMGLVGLTRQGTQRLPLDGTLSKPEVETIVQNLTAKLTITDPEILSATMQVAYAVQSGKQLPEWSVLSRAGQDNYLFRVNGRTGAVFGINRLDDISGQGPNISGSGTPIQAGLTPPLPNRAPQSTQVERSSEGRQAAESAARRYLPTLGLLTREVHQIPDKAEASYEVEGGESRVWTFTYFLKRSEPLKGAIRVSVDSATGRLESYWNPAFSK